MYKLRKILILGLAVFISPQAIYGAQLNSVPPPISITEQLESEFSILIDANTGHIIHGVNMINRAYPASMTKVMTALLLLESGHAMSTPIRHSHEAISDVMPWHSGLAYVDEYLTVEEALYAIMLASANCTSNAIAEFLGGSMENFARMMTVRAHQLGAVNTNFANAHGLWEEGHYTTAFDMALIMREALTHQLFRDIIATQNFEIPPSIHYDEYRLIYNTNRMIFPTSMHFSPDSAGGKTGFTNNSRHTLVSLGQRGDIELITVVMYAEQRDMMYTDTRILMDYGFGQFAAREVFLAQDFQHYLDLVQRSSEGVLVIGEIGISAATDVSLSLPVSFDTNSITMNVQLPDRIMAPVAEGFVVGRVLLEHQGNVLAEVALLTAHAGYRLSESDLVALFPGGGAAYYTYYGADGTSGDSLSAANFILNVSLVTIGVLVFAFVMLRFLQFSRRSRRRRSLGKYSGYRGYSGPYRVNVNVRDYKFRYRYK